MKSVGKTPAGSHVEGITQHIEFLVQVIPEITLYYKIKIPAV